MSKSQIEVAKPENYKDPLPPTNYPIAAKPKREIFDPWNSSSTGHQRAENRLSGSTSWRNSRSAKLAEQFRSGNGGGKRVADTVGAGSESFERGERTANGGWKRGVIRDRTSGQISLWASFGVSKAGVEDENDADAGINKRRRIEEHGGLREDEMGRTSEDPQLNWKSSQQSLPLSQESHMPSPPPEDEAEPDRLRRRASHSQPDSSAESYDTALLNSIYDHRHILPPDDEPPQSGQLISSAPTPSSIERYGIKRPRSQPPMSPSRAPTAQEVTGDPGHSPPQIFRNLTIYINGSTYPTISDHKLKHLLVTHGANISIMLGRRTVTHVILGQTATTTPSTSSARPSSSSAATTLSRGGGGLAATKIQKEIAQIRRSGGNGVKYVSVEWVLACVKAGRRVGERGFEVISTGPAGVKGVHKVFGRA